MLFFKQKTAYDMRISDWSSDVCSSDLLKMGGMDFTISTATRQTSEDALLKDAVNAFKARAQLATEALGGKGYKIVNLNLNSNGYPQPYMRPQMMMQAASMDAESVTDRKSTRLNSSH